MARPAQRDPRFTRARLRAEVLPLLEDVLGGGVAEALARTATALQEDGDVLDGIAARALADARAGGAGLPVDALTPLPDAVRRRVIRGWLQSGGAVRLTAKQILGVDALVTSWRGQGGVAVGMSCPVSASSRAAATAFWRCRANRSDGPVGPAGVGMAI